MPPKVARVGSNKSTQVKTMAKASTSSSSKSSGTSKTTSSSSAKQSTQIAAKPKNVDRVDFGKPKPTASAGVYKPAPAPKSMAAKREDPFTEMHNKKCENWKIKC